MVPNRATHHINKTLNGQNADFASDAKGHSSGSYLYFWLMIFYWDTPVLIIASVKQLHFEKYV